MDRRAHPVATRTSNFHLGALKALCRWMTEDGRAASSPLRRLRAVTVTDEQERGIFTVAQVQTLLKVTTTSDQVLCGMDGPTRSLLYEFAVSTGLRAGSIASLTRDSFRFAKDGSCVVTVEAAHVKNRRRHRVPLRASLASQVRPLLARTPADRPVFPLKRGRGAGILRDDLADTGLPSLDSEGNKLVFHSFRHTAGTWLSEQGVDLKVVQAILGHRTFALTADRYTHTRMERVAAEMAKMPELRATGTDDPACRMLDFCVSNDDQTSPRPTNTDRVDDVESAITRWRGGGAVERAGLENRYGLRPIVGSNPTLSVYPRALCARG